MSSKGGGKDLESKDKRIQAVQVATEEIKRDEAEELGQRYKLAKAWKTQNDEPEHDMLYVEVLVKAWEKAKSDQNSSQRVTSPVAFFNGLREGKTYQGVQLERYFNDQEQKV